METSPAQRPTPKPLILTSRHEEILKTIHFYRYVTALDIAYLHFSPASLTHVRSLLARLAGGGDFINHQYLYRFPLPSSTTGNHERIYTLGVKGRNFLANELGLPVNWYFRPHKLKHLSYGQVLHNLILTRFVVSAHRWASQQSDFKLIKLRIGYELAEAPSYVKLTEKGKPISLKVVPDAWLLFDKFKDGQWDESFPILLEIDRGTEFRQRFKRHVASRVELIRTGAYAKLFDTQAVIIAYATFGDTPQYRDSRLSTMRKWTMEVIKEKYEDAWAGIFRFTSLSPDDIYNSHIFEEPVWYRPDESAPVTLFAT